MKTETDSPESEIHELNDEQKKAAFCAANAVVAAGAGSGKTMVLANRFAWLITEKNLKVEEILTLTFTKKAASQMFRRIHSLLTSISIGASVGASNGANELKTQRAKEALDNFIRARIQTLDSYSASIVKQCAARYGISPEFKIDPERCREIAIEESLPFLIKHRHHPAIERLYADNRPGNIAHEIFCEVLNNFCFIDKKKEFINDIKNQFNIVCKEWEDQTKEITVLIQELENLKGDIPVMCPDLVPVMDKYTKKSVTTIKTAQLRSYFDQLLNASVKTVIEESENHPMRALLSDYLHYISDFYNAKTIKGKPRSNPVKDTLKQIKLAFGKFSSLVVYCMQAGLMLSFASLLNDLQERYLQKKRAEGVLSFADAASLSRTILLEQKDIRQSEKKAFKAIMIDEFQDNNELQKDLLFLLAEKIEKSGGSIPTAENLTPDKLFFVGDEKQSIYRFRGADVSVFRKLKDEIKSASLPLKTNYRSVSGLIGAFNAIFGGSDFDASGKDELHKHASVFAPEHSPTLPLYEAAYSQLQAKNEGGGSLSICLLNTKDEDEQTGNDNEDTDIEYSPNSKESINKSDKTALNAVENEARFVAEKIASLLAENKYQAKDIAILFRSHNPQYLFEKHLRLLGIPYTSEDINDLFYSGIVNDIMSVLRLAAHPLDSASYAEMLRSPFAGLSLSATALCLSIYNTSEEKNPFSDEPLAFLDEEDSNKYLSGRKVYFSIRDKAASESISSLVSELWFNEGYRYETEWHPNTNVYREYYDYLYHLAVQADNANQGLAVFTEDILALRDSKERLRDIVIPLDRPGAVHLMTVHKSKGLEFPVVFVCCCGKRSRTNTIKKADFLNEAGIVFDPPVPKHCHGLKDIKKNFFWEQAKIEESGKNTAELRRLLYVAMTRAEEKLFITGSLDIKEDKDDCDFSLKLKNHINKLYEDKEKEKKNDFRIEGDSIINNDTFFGLLLPVIVSRITPEGLLAENSKFFNIEAIPVYTENYIKSQNAKNNQEGRHTAESINEYIGKFESVYDNARIITTPTPQSNHFTPARLQKDINENNDAVKAMFDTNNFILEKTFIINKEFSGEKSDDIFNKTDLILSRINANGDSEQKFNAANFGTIAHACVEALLNNRDVIIPPNIACLVKPEELKTLIEAGGELAKRFALSPLGIIAQRAAHSAAQNAVLCESEFPFRTIIKNKNGSEFFINGAIDLFFEDKDCIHVVDFKTDAQEIPERHIAQMTCYYRAVSGLFAKKTRVWLYYLRSGAAVEATDVKH